jgi:hypothetical protein
MIAGRTPSPRFFFSRSSQRRLITIKGRKAPLARFRGGETSSRLATRSVCDGALRESSNWLILMLRIN